MNQFDQDSQTNESKESREAKHPFHSGKKARGRKATQYPANAREVEGDSRTECQTER